LGGWAERLVEARVGAFVGAMWEVNDGLALQFARRFYTGLLKGNQTIAEAFRQAREEIRQLAPYNSTWLAYALYADPEGRFKDSPLADKASAEIRKTDSNHINSSDTPPSNSNQNSTEVRNAQNKKSLGLKWWIQYIIAPRIGVVIVYVITAIINAPTSKFPQQESSRSPKPNTLLK
jgi:CHAT domain-containing protein